SDIPGPQGLRFFRKDVERQVDLACEAVGRIPIRHQRCSWPRQMNLKPALSDHECDPSILNESSVLKDASLENLQYFARYLGCWFDHATPGSFQPHLV